MLYWLVSLAALLGVVLNIRKSAWCFPIWIGTNATWAVVDWTHGLVAQAALMLVYLILAIYGCWRWTMDEQRGESA